MPLDLVQSREEARAALQDHDFSEGLENFRIQLDKLKAEFLEIPPFIHPVDWAAEHIKLKPGETSRSGDFKATVYQRVMFDGLVDPSVKQVTVLKGVQIGFSKALKVAFAYTIAELAKRAAVAFPTQRDVKRFYKDEIADMYQSVDALSNIIRDQERGVAQDTWYEQRFINGAIAYFRAAFNEDDLQSFTSWLMLADEVDRSGWQQRKDDAGDKLEQYRNRGTDLKGSKLIVGSTPGVRHLSVIWKQWLTSDQRKLHIQCPNPNCKSEPQVMVWGTADRTKPGFTWDLDANGKVERAYYRCIGSTEENPCYIYEDGDEATKEEVIESGIYKPTTVASEPGNIGIHVPSWLSMSPNSTWKDLAQQWLNAQDDIEKLKEFFMFKMAEPWDEFDSRSFTDERLADKLRSYPAEVPDDVVVLVIGGDDQTNKEGDAIFKVASREISVVGFNRQKQPRLILHKVIPGTVGDASADAIYRFYIDRPYLKADGSKWYVQATAMDMGGHHGDETLLFANSFPASRCVFAIRGSSQTEGTRLPTMWPSTIGTSLKGKKKLFFYTVDSQAAKDFMAGQLLLAGRHAPMFPSSVPSDYFEKLTCEHQVKQKNGGYHWEPKKGRRAEEEWVTLAYAYVALEGLRKKKPGLWRDMNLAASKRNVPDIAVDEETDALLWEYDGPDQSIMAKEKPEEFPDVAQHTFRTVKVEGPSSQKEQNTNKATTEAKVPQPVVGEVKRKKKRRGGIVGWA